MKRILACFLMFAIMFALTACEKTKNDKLSDKAFELGCAALETIEDYAASKIDGKDAIKRLNTAHRSLERYIESEKEELGGTLVGTDVWVDETILHNITMSIYEIEDKERGTGTMSDVNKYKNDLEKYLYK